MQTFIYADTTGLIKFLRTSLGSERTGNQNLGCKYLDTMSASQSVHCIHSSDATLSCLGRSLNEHHESTTTSWCNIGGILIDMFNLPGSAVQQRAGIQAFRMTGNVTTRCCVFAAMASPRPKTIGELSYNHDWGSLS
jgi:hypothetical protein